MAHSARLVRCGTTRQGLTPIRALPGTTVSALPNGGENAQPYGDRRRCAADVDGRVRLLQPHLLRPWLCLFQRQLLWPPGRLSLRGAALCLSVSSLLQLRLPLLRLRRPLERSRLSSQRPRTTRMAAFISLQALAL